MKGEIKITSTLLINYCGDEISTQTLPWGSFSVSSLLTAGNEK